MAGLLEGNHLVTIVGPGGSGKTSLAIEAGRALADGTARRVQPIEAGGAVDGSVDAATAAQLAVRRVHDGVDALDGDVTRRDLEMRRHVSATPLPTNERPT